MTKLSKFGKSLVCPACLNSIDYHTFKKLFSMWSKLFFNISQTTVDACLIVWLREFYPGHNVSDKVNKKGRCNLTKEKKKRLVRRPTS